MEQKFITVPFDVEKAKAIQNGELEGNIVDTYYHCKARIVDFNFITVKGKFIIIVSERNGDDEVYAICNEKGIIYLEKEGKFENEPCFLIEIPEYLTFKDGDVITDDDGCVLLFSGDVNQFDLCGCYCSLSANTKSLDLNFDYKGVFPETRLATDSEKQQLIGALQVSTDPRAIDCLKKLGVEVKPKREFTAGQPVVGMKQHMIAKVESAKEYTAVIVEKAKERHEEDIDAVMKLFREGYVWLAFEAGWDAAVNYLAKLPFDKMLKYFNEALEDVTMEEVIEENKDVLKRLKDK